MSASEEMSETGESQASAILQTMIVQQVNMALICLGQMADEKGQKRLDLDGARFFIGVLEMLEVKTKGNLTSREQTMLNQSLASLRLAYVEVANAAASTSKKAPETTPEQPAAAPSSAGIETPDEAESRKKFTKKY